MLKTGSFTNQYFNITNIKANVRSLTTYISKGERHKYGSCRGVNFMRNFKNYEYSYERSTAEVLVQTINLATTTGLTDESPTDVLLPNNIQLPITKQEAMSPLFGTIAWEQPTLGCSKSELSDEHIEMFEGIVQINKKREVNGSNTYAEALVTHYSDARSPDQISFGFSLRRAITLCEVKAFSTNEPDVTVIFLDTFDRPYQFAKDADLIRPHLTNARAVATGMHIKTNENAHITARQLYDANCMTETKTIRNLQNILRSADISTSLQPYFGRGYLAIPSGSVVHIVQCKALDASVDQSRDECTSQLPVILRNSKNEKINSTRYADANTRILSPVGTKIQCSSTLPVSYKLDNGDYLCKGKEFFHCKEISTFQPSVSNLADKLAKEFTTPLGIGIMSQEKITSIAHRAFLGVLQSHYESEQIYRNMQKHRLERLEDLEPEFSKSYEEDFQDQIAKLVSPMFHLFGRWTIIILGGLFLAMFLGSTCGCFSRSWTTYSLYGCSPRLFFSMFNGLHQLMVLIPNFVKGGYNRATRMPADVMTANMTPLMDQMNELRKIVYALQNGDSPPPYPSAPHLSATPLDGIFPNQIITEDVMEEDVKPPRRIKKLYPDLRRYKLFRAIFQKNGRSQDDGERPNPNLNVDGIIPADPSGMSASSIIPEHPADLVYGHMYAPRPTAPPPPPPTWQDVPGPSQPLLQPPAPQFYHPNQGSGYFPMGALGQQSSSSGHFPMGARGQPSSSAAAIPPVPSPPKRRKTMSPGQQRPPPLRLVLEEPHDGTDVNNASQPTPPPEAGATVSTSAAALAAAGTTYLAARDFARKIQPCVTEVDSPMDTTPPKDSPPLSPMDFSGPSSPTAPAPVVPQPSARDVAKRVAKIFKQ